jgi:CRP-like cAMP-binding protein
MLTHEELSKPVKNRILTSLSRETLDRLLAHLEQVDLTLGMILFNPFEPIRYVYFPQRATVSLVNILEDGSTVEVAVVGSEGMIGLPLFLGTEISPQQAIVQVADGGLRMKARDFKDLIGQNDQLKTILLRYTQALMTQIAQTATCNRLHTIEERLARWLLLTQDRMEAETFNLTQEFIATMLGSRRAGVTVAAGALQRAGLIKYRRGEITVVDREGLEDASCECYKIVKNEFNRLLGD